MTAHSKLSHRVHQVHPYFKNTPAVFQIGDFYPPFMSCAGMLLLLSAKAAACSALIYALCSSDFNRIKQEGSKGKMWPFVAFTVCASLL